jgi:plastocyanin
MLNRRGSSRRAVTAALICATVTLCATAPTVGAGLNTAQPGNAANHHILPRVIRVKQGGVVNFVVAGFHWILVYKPGTDAEDVQAFVDTLGTPKPTFINFGTAAPADKLLYIGINPAVPAPPLSNAPNRVESVSFARKGTYLVICNVTEHFEDGMVALVKVGDDKDDDHHHGDR